MRKRILNYLIYRYEKIYYPIRLFFVRLHPYVHIGRGTIIEKGAYIKPQWGGEIFIGENCRICKGAQLLTNGDDIYIGDNCSVNPYTIIYGQGKTRIGNDVRIAAHCVIVSSNHIYSSKSTPIHEQGLSKKGIVIEDDIWIGAGCVILDGVNIKKGCIIGANSVVTKSTESYGVYVGSPAKLLKNR